MVRFQRVAGRAVLAVFLAACSKDATGVTADVTGTWNGAATSSGVTFNVSVTLSDAGDSAISGSGVVTGSGGSFGGTGGSVPVTISGRQSGASLTLSFNASGFVSAIYPATLRSASEMDGALNGSGFTNLALKLTKS